MQRGKQRLLPDYPFPDSRSRGKLWQWDQWGYLSVYSEDSLLHIVWNEWLAYLFKFCTYTFTFIIVLWINKKSGRAQPRHAQQCIEVTISESRVPFPMTSLDVSVDLILTAALSACDRLWQIWASGILMRVKGSRCPRKKPSPLSVNRLPRKCESLHVSLSYKTARQVK
jgi:hypothetical protein